MCVFPRVDKRLIKPHSANENAIRAFVRIAAAVSLARDGRVETHSSSLLNCLSIGVRAIAKIDITGLQCGTVNVKMREEWKSK